MGWINPMILIISWTTLLICFCDIYVTSYVQKYQKYIDLGDNGVLSMNKEMKISSQVVVDDLMMDEFLL